MPLTGNREGSWRVHSGLPSLSFCHRETQKFYKNFVEKIGEIKLDLPVEGETREGYVLNAYFRQGEVPTGWYVKFPTQTREYYDYSRSPEKPKKSKAVEATLTTSTYDAAIHEAELVLNCDSIVSGNNFQNNYNNGGKIRIYKTKEEMKWQVTENKPVVTLH